MRSLFRVRLGCILIALTMLVVARSGRANELEDGMQAYARGDYPVALRLFQKPANQGEPQAQFNLGVMHEFGYGTVPDLGVAIAWYSQAANSGHAKAQFNLGVLYDAGRGVVQDYVLAARWYRMAAAQGHAGAQFNLGGMYYEGQGVTQDRVRAYMWFMLAAEAGFDGAVKNRNVAAGLMTQAQIVQAQQLARECRRAEFKKCD